MARLRAAVTCNVSPPFNVESESKNQGQVFVMLILRLPEGDRCERGVRRPLGFSLERSRSQAHEGEPEVPCARAPLS